MKRLTAQVIFSLRKHVEAYKRRWHLLRQKLHSRSSWMNPELQGIEIKCSVPGDHDLTIQHATLGHLPQQRIDKLGKVTVQWFLIPALNKDFVMVAKNQCAKPIPFGLEDPCALFWQFLKAFRKHRQDGRLYGQAHASW